MKRFQHSLRLKPDAWHVRWYRLWLSLGGSEPKYKENLCHYVRVLVFWAPLRWLVNGSVKGLRAWVLPAAAVLAVALGYTYYLWPETFLTVATVAGKVLGVLVVAAVVIVGGVLGGGWVYDEHRHEVKRYTKPVWIGPYLLYRGVYWVGQKAEKSVGRFLDWFIGKYYPVGLTVTACLAFVIWRWPDFSMAAAIIGAKIIGVIVGAVIAIVLLILALYFLAETWKNGLKQAVKGFLAGCSDTVKLGATYVASQKQGSRVCPFLEFEDSQAQT